MSLVEETLTSYDDYKDRIKELEKAGPSKASVAAKNRVVFLFRQAEEDKELNAGLEGARKKGIKGTLIHVLIKKAEFADPNCPYKTDPKFKVPDLPFGIVFNQKLTQGRDWVHKKVVGADAKTEIKLIDLFK